MIGFGGGNTARFYSELPEVEEIVIVELLENITPMLDGRLDHIRPLLDDQRVTYIVDDGRRYLYANPQERFDLIFMDPFRNYTAGSNNLYSREALTLYRDHLSENGVLCLWKDELHVIPATAASVFPYADDYFSFMVTASQPIRYDFNAAQHYFNIQENYGPPSIKADKIDPYRVFIRYQRSIDRIRADEAAYTPLSDLYPALEYYYFNKPTWNLPLEKDPPQMLLDRLDGCDAQCKERILANW